MSSNRLEPASSLFERVRRLIVRRGLVLLGLVVLAALPAVVSVERSGAGLESVPDPLEPARVEAVDWASEPGGPEPDIAWEGYADVEASEALDAEGFDCMIEPWEEVEIRSPVVGRIDAIHVERSDRVEKGDLLVELDSDLAQAELDVAAKRAGMTASIRSLQARRELGAKRGNRAEELFSRNAIALDAKDEILTEKKISNYDLEDAEDRHDLAVLQFVRERARFDQRRIRSPVTGIVSNRLMSVGEVTDEETVLEIAQIDPLRVEVILPAVELGSVRPGMQAAVIPEIPGDEVLVAKVRFVDGIVDSASGTFGAELELPNPDHAVPGGLRCRVRFTEAEGEPDALARVEPDAP